MKKAFLIFLLFGLVSCGGGTSSTSTDVCENLKEILPPIKTEGMVFPEILSESIDDGASDTQFLIQTKSDVAFGNDLYVRVTDTGSVFQQQAQPLWPFDSNLALKVFTYPAISLGRKQGTLTLTFCHDSLCSSLYSQQPISIPYDINVTSSSNLKPLNNLNIGEWSTYQKDNTHTGYVPLTLDPKNFSIRWQRFMAPNIGLNQVSFNNQSVTSMKGSVYWSSPSSLLSSINELTGNVNWTHAFDPDTTNVMSAATIYNDNIYMFVGRKSSNQFERYVELLEMDSLAQNIYRLDIVGSPDSLEILLPPMVDATGTYPNPTIASTGTTMASDGNRKYRLLGEAYTFATWLSFDNGSIPSRYTAGYKTPFNSAPVIGSNGMVFATNGYQEQPGSNALIAFDTVTESIPWAVNGDYIGSPTVSNGMLYIANRNPMQIEARDQGGNGQLLWTWSPAEFGDRTFISNMVLAKNILFVSTDQHVFAISLCTHKPVWSIRRAGALSISNSGVLYINQGMSLFAINLL